MKLLLDTHVFLWMQASPGRLSADALELVTDRRNVLLLSAASSWEIAVKYSIGKLPLPEAPLDYVPERMRRSGVQGLPVDHADALHIALLPPHHRDPFDRLLVAQAQRQRLPILTSDASFDAYDVETRPAL